jgi:hypothetical protein
MVNERDDSNLCCVLRYLLFLITGNIDLTR